MTNIQIYDTVFRSYFNDKKRFLSLGNAVLHTNYQNESDVEFNTLAETMYSKMKNDISCLLGNFFLVITEHQSTVNPNMPFRYLCYAVELYQQIIAPNKRAMYGSRLIKLPVPRFIMFYDGLKIMPEHQVLRLSNAFGGDDAYLEATVEVYNITAGHSQGLKTKCDYLRQYSEFTACYRDIRRSGKLADDAVRETIKYCHTNGIMTDWLKEHESEVFRMLHFEWNDDDAREVWREEALEEGRAEGKKQGAFNALIDVALRMLKSQTPIDVIMKFVNLPRETIEQIAKDNNLRITT